MRSMWSCRNIETMKKRREESLRGLDGKNRKLDMSTQIALKEMVQNALYHTESGNQFRRGIVEAYERGFLETRKKLRISFKDCKNYNFETLSKNEEVEQLIVDELNLQMVPIKELIAFKSFSIHFTKGLSCLRFIYVPRNYITVDVIITFK